MLDTSLQFIKGVGPRYAKLFEKLGIISVEDFIYFFPRAYDDRRALPKISDVKIGQVCSLIVTVVSCRINPTNDRKKSIVKAVLRDSSGVVQATWFNQAYVHDLLKPGGRVFIRGKLEYSHYDRIKQISVSDFECLDIKSNPHRVVPVYGLSQGLSQKVVRTISQTVLDQYLRHVRESIPTYVIQKLSLIPKQMSIKAIHIPLDFEQYTRARYRIVFEEFFWFQLGLLLRRMKIRNHFTAFPLQAGGDLVDQYLKGLPYSLTSAQKRVIEDIRKDVKHLKPMNRMIQGDVGCGKTDVAVCTILFAIESGKNAVIMAPTEILAMQHYAKFKAQLASLSIPVLMLKGKLKAAEKRKVKEQLLQDNGYVLVGTHAVIQHSVSLSNVGVIIVDEQHRFGVEQRMALVRKGDYAHSLYLTATPIPRSFMLTVFGDLDTSIIDEMPPGRIRPKTISVPEGQLKYVYEHCISQIQKGFQVYCVFPLVEDSDKLDLTSAESALDHLSHTYFSGYSLGLLHGRMSDDEKLDVMNRFRSAEFQILIATTVIEVGIDVPNATTIVIHHSERFGLSQLHQLRGRVGRGGGQSWCYLISSSKSDSVKTRNDIMVKTSDGFKIAEHDLAIRGPGDLMGRRQSGLPDFKLGDILRDQKVMVLARNLAKDILVADPNLAEERHSSIRFYLQQKGLDYRSMELN